MTETMMEWVATQQSTHPDAAHIDDLIEVRAVAIYRMVWLLEQRKSRDSVASVAESLRSWLGAL